MRKISNKLQTTSTENANSSLKTYVIIEKIDKKNWDVETEDMRNIMIL